MWGEGNDQSYGYSYYNYVNDGGPEQNCYSCTFHEAPGETFGVRNCGDPFNPEGIPIVPCKGSCGEIYHALSATEFTQVRACLPYCKDVEMDNGYTRCCTGNLCNGGDA